MKYLLLAIFVLVFPRFLSGQNVILPDPDLKIHTDKIIYTTPEKTWFTALLSNVSVADTMEYHTLFLSLIDPSTRKVMQSCRYLIHNGVSSGTMEIPDTIGAKELVLIGYTNNLLRNKAEKPVIKGITYNAPLRHLPVSQLHQQEKLPSKYLVHGVITCDSIKFHKRSLVKCSIKLNSSQANAPLQGIASISCVRSERLPLNPEQISGNTTLNFDDKSEKQLNVIPDELWNPWHGQVMQQGKPWKKKNKIACYYNGRMMIIQTDANGGFELDRQLMYAQDSSSLYFAPIGNSREGTITVVFPTAEDHINKVISQSPLLTMETVVPDNSKVLSPDSVLVTPNTRNLKGVEVQAKKIVFDDPYRFELVRGSDSSCNTWVCRYDHLNCEDLPLIYPAIPGRIYKQKDPLTRKEYYEKYVGCNSMKAHPVFHEVRLTHLPESFPALDAATIQSNESYTESTIYWNPLIVTDENGEATFSFYTNDLTGAFTCTVQGLTNSGPFQANAYFEVVP